MKISAGILMYRLTPELEVFLVHPGGPFFAHKDLGAWSIPKGEVKENETYISTAVREFKEETGVDVENESSLIFLDEVTMKSGKRVFAWAFKKDFSGQIESNMVNHPVYGEFPEVDKGEYFSVSIAKNKVNPAQIPFIDRLLQHQKDSDERIFS